MNWAVADQVIPSVSVALAVRVVCDPAGRPVTVTATGWSTSAACGDTDIDALTRSRVHPVNPAATANSTIKTGICRTRHNPACPAMATFYPCNRPTSLASSPTAE